MLLSARTHVDLCRAPLQGCAVMKLKCWRRSLCCLVFTAGVSSSCRLLSHIKTFGLLCFTELHTFCKAQTKHTLSAACSCCCQASLLPSFVSSRFHALFPPLFPPLFCGVCMCVLVLVQSTENTHSTPKVRIFLGREDILAGPHDYKGQFDG